MFSASLFSEYILRVRRSFHVYPAFQSLLTTCAVCTSQARYRRRSYAHSDPACMTVAWPNGAGCAVFPVVDVGLTLKERKARGDGPAQRIRNSCRGSERGTIRKAIWGLTGATGKISCRDPLLLTRKHR